MKQFLVTWLAAFAVVTPLLYTMQSLVVDWPIWTKALAISGVMVLAMQRAIMPIINKYARG